MGYTVGVQYALGVSAKRSNHTVDLANMGGGDRYFSIKKVKNHTVGTQYTVGVSGKRSTYTMDLANMGGSDCYL